MLLYRRLRPVRHGTARVIYYHRIDAEEHRSCVAPRMFAAQMALLRAEGFHVVPLRELATNLAEKRAFAPRTVAVTFDDGFADNYTAAFPVLQRESIPATIFLTAGYIGSDGLPVLRDHVPPRPLDWPQVIEMARHGVDFGAHTVTHPSLTEIPRDEMRREIVDSRTIIEQRSGVRVATFCYPRGRFDARVKQVVRDAGYTLACTTMPGVVTPDTHPFSLRRTFIARDDTLRDFVKKLDGAFDSLHGALQWWRGETGAPGNEFASPGRAPQTQDQPAA